ncbi:MAG: PadR family transcriptional regulator [Minisyncoccus archaeiphilus]|uniref:PadR family transcriptional regulator n=1 Tax=Minisyncoccus archaeiphilus TaxID=3238481 RepID=UPI0009D55449|nr:MAG: lineage-specific thermal regulator protein [Parcubacteria group bacterium ADurb.Bin216]GMX59779.1 MAG: PadR family transcriptional regulator [Candidatus Parcubacteria bacterium]
MRPFERLQKLNTKENLWIYILKTVQDNPHHGWEFPIIIEKEFGFKPGTITPYRVLYSLEAEGLVTSKYEERRRIYNITDKGKQELENVREYYKELIRKIS